MMMTMVGTAWTRSLWQRARMLTQHVSPRLCCRVDDFGGTQMISAAPVGGAKQSPLSPEHKQGTMAVRREARTARLVM